MAIKQVGDVISSKMYDRFKAMLEEGQEEKETHEPVDPLNNFYNASKKRYYRKVLDYHKGNTPIARNYIGEKKAYRLVNNTSKLYK